MQLINLKKNQSGFTLVEIAIVLVIIGLLLGGVLKGKEMIKSAKVKKTVKMADELRAATMTFYDKYGAYPGDENKKNIPPKDKHEGNGTGFMDRKERYMVFEDLMKAGFISGSYDGEKNLPRHAFGGDVAIYWTKALSAPADHYIVMWNLPWDAAMEIDMKYDDGKERTGSIRSSERYAESSGPIGYIIWAF